MRRVLLASVFIFAALPATSNYRLNSYGFGSGGTANSQTATYSLEGSVGELSGQSTDASQTGIKPGFIQTEQANAPTLAALDNNSGLYYNKLHFVIDPQGNPSDAQFLMSISTDNFVSDVRYLQPDGTLSATLLLSDYQTFSAWGGNSGALMIGLIQNTSYSVRLKATQGKFTESAYGPVTVQSTAPASLSFNLSTSAQSAAPLTVSLGELRAGTINTATDTINIGLSTNGTTGANVYIKAKNSGLLSASTGYKINAVSNDLDVVSEGFGGRSNGASQTSGGPFTAVTPYDGTNNTVGSISSSTSSLYSSSTPVNSAAGLFLLKAKSAATDVASLDYQEVITFTAAGNF